MDRRAYPSPHPDGPLFSGPDAPRRIGVFRALQLGDMLCAVPALRALRAAAPTAHITLIGLPWAAGFARRYRRYVDAFASFPGFPGLPEHPVELARIPEFIAAMQAQRFDLLLQIHGSGGLTNPLVMSFGATCNAGFYVEGNFCPDAQLFIEWDEGLHEIRRNLQLLEWLGAPAQGENLEFPLRDEDCLALRRSCEKLPAPGTYACIHPGARLLSRRWHAERFSRVADCLQEAGNPVVLTGAAEEVPLVHAVECAMRTTPLNLCGKTDLGAFAALVAGARLMVCNDTGASHIATAVNTPSVVICCGADPQRWAPLDRSRHRTLFADVSCRPCMFQECPTGHACAEQVGIDAVLDEMRQLLADLGTAKPLINAH